MKKQQILDWCRRRKVAVLKGGWSRERSISLKTGDAIEQSLKRLGIPFVSIDVKPNIKDVLFRKKIKFCLIALHGTFGEDGQIQHICDGLKIPYTGSGPVSSSLAMNKDVAKFSSEEAVFQRRKGLL